jgi:molybdenum cofactor cytidylyltransferase
LYLVGLILYPAQAMRSLDTITPIILAAGDSRRMGHPKALLPIGNNTFLNHILEILEEVGLPDPVIVLGRAAELIRPTVQNRAVEIKINPDPSRGQLSSIQIGISSLEPDAQACMIWPVDQPAVSAELVRQLVCLFSRSECLIAYPKHAEKRGHPAIFHRSLFPEFLESALHEGPQKILLRHLQATAELPTHEAGSIRDIDTPLDYEALTGESIETALSRLEFSHP